MMYRTSLTSLVGLVAVLLFVPALFRSGRMEMVAAVTSIHRIACRIDCTRCRIFSLVRHRKHDVKACVFVGVGVANISGTGSGLATRPRIIDDHQGRTGVESNADQGSTLLFTILNETEERLTQT